MRTVLATDAFASVGGSETYLLTVAEHLQRLGHGVTIHAVTLGGGMAELARARGIHLAPELDDLPAECDVILSQDGGVAYALAERWPRTPQVFVCHSALFDLQLPPFVAGVVGVVVVLSDRVERRIRALDPAYEVVRLRQPIDTERLVPRGAPRPRPERALLLGNYLRGDARRAIVDTWTDAGIEMVEVGAHATVSLHPEEQIAAADIVVGKGRALLDAMSCGRPAYLYDAFGTDGWVTPEIYPLLEADAFAGQASPLVASVDRLRGDLEAYDPLMGRANRELTMNHHQARAHAEALVGLFRRLAPAAATTSTPNRELARLIRLRWRAEGELFALRGEFAAAADLAAAELQALRTELQTRHAADLDAAVRAARRAHKRRLAAVQREAEARIQSLTARRDVRIGLALGRGATRLRRALRP